MAQSLSKSPRFFVKSLLAAVAAAAFTCVLSMQWVGCNSPTLPLPPPVEGSIEAKLEASGDSVEVVGKSNAVEPHALVTCFNNRTGTGVVVLADDNGAFSTKLAAGSGDTVEIWQRVGNEPPAVSLAVK